MKKKKETGQKTAMNRPKPTYLCGRNTRSAAIFKRYHCVNRLRAPVVPACRGVLSNLLRPIKPSGMSGAKSGDDNTRRSRQRRPHESNPTCCWYNRRCARTATQEATRRAWGMKIYSDCPQLFLSGLTRSRSSLFGLHWWVPQKRVNMPRV